MNRAWTLNIDQEWIAWLTFDQPEEKVNLFTSSTLNELGEWLDQLADNEAIKAVAIRSGKDGSFIAGADINELAAIGSPDEARSKANAGHMVFEKIEKLPVPAVAVIHGACLGGGLEMALACHYRIVSDDSSTTLGLPEVKLGILPGWGGTQRLPRLIGLAQALPMVLSGKTIPARQAYRIGLADGISAPVFLERETHHFINRVLTRRGRREALRRRRESQPRIMRMVEAARPSRWLIYRRAAREIARHTNGHYPAPIKALDVMRRTFRRTPLSHGLAVEAEALGELACSPESRNLVWLFQAGQRLKKHNGDAAKHKSAPVQSGGVVGSGVMGAGIAWACSCAKFPVRLRDVNWDVLARGLSAASSMCRVLVKRRKMTEAEMNLTMHRISPTIDYAGFSRLDVVIEAVVEDMEIKKAVLREIESHVSPKTIIASNTSSLSLADLAGALRDPSRFVGLHFFNPVNRMPLVEVIPTRRTSRETVNAAVGFVNSLGKTPIVVGDCAGFLVNRILVPYLVESTWMFEEGVDPSHVDRVLEDFGMPMGPLALIDEVGIDVGYKVARVLEEAYGSRMQVPGGLAALAVSSTMLGRKSGRGIFTYRNGHRKPNPEAIRLVESARDRDRISPRRISRDDIVDRAVLVMVNEAARCLEEGVVKDPEVLDMAMILGTGFAAFHGGLLRYADERGVKEITRRLYELAAMYGDRFAPAPLLERIASNGGQFYARSGGMEK